MGKMKKTEIFYRYGIPNSVTVQVDSREQRPIKFPSTVMIAHPERTDKRLLIEVKTKKIALPYGDYRLAEYPTCCVIERKAGQRELYKNFFNPRDSVRQAKSFRKLSQCEYPYLLIELAPADVLQRNPNIPDTEALLNRVSMVFAKYRFHALWIPWRSSRKSSRRQLGTFLVHLMLSCALKKSYNILPEVMENE